MTNPHLALLEKAELLLRPLPHKVVFVGGASVSMHLDDPAARVRPTRDIDFVVEATSYAEHALLEKKLRALGFTQDPNSDDPVCRWHKDGLLLDMMPTDPTILGFGTSRWFDLGFASAATYELPNGNQIYAFDALQRARRRNAAQSEAHVWRSQSEVPGEAPPELSCERILDTHTFDDLSIVQILSEQDSASRPTSSRQDKGVPEGQLLKPVEFDRVVNHVDSHDNRLEACIELHLSLNYSGVHPQLPGGYDEVLLEHLS